MQTVRNIVYKSLLSLFWVFLVFLFTGDVSAGTLQIVFTSNINGALQNCGCGVEPLGGIGRIKTVLDSIRKVNKDVLLIDGGDFLNSYPYPNLNSKMLQSIHKMDYDVIVPGDHEFVEGYDFFKKIYTELNNAVLISNQEPTGAEKQFAYPGLRVAVSGFVAPAVFENIDRPESFTLINPDKSEMPVNSDTFFNILVFHGDKRDAAKIAEKHPGIDLILLGHDHFKGVQQIGDAVIVGNGRDSEYFSLITVETFSPNKVQTRHIKVIPTIPEDKGIKKIIDAFLQTEHGSKPE